MSSTVRLTLSCVTTFRTIITSHHSYRHELVIKISGKQESSYHTVFKSHKPYTPHSVVDSALQYTYSPYITFDHHRTLGISFKPTNECHVELCLSPLDSPSRDAEITINPDLSQLYLSVRLSTISYPSHPLFIRANVLIGAEADAII